MVRRDGGQGLHAAGDASGCGRDRIVSGVGHARATRRLRTNCESRAAGSPATGCWAPRTAATRSSAASGWLMTGARSLPSNSASPSSSRSVVTIAAPSTPSFRRPSRRRRGAGAQGEASLLWGRRLAERRVGAFRGVTTGSPASRGDGDALDLDWSGIGSPCATSDSM
jgi:hypothetical protein